MLNTKRYHKTVSVVLIAAMITVSSVFSTGIDVHANNVMEKINFDTDYADATYTNVPGTLLYYEDGVSEEIQYKCAVGWVLIPDSMKQKLIEYNAAFYISETVDLTPINEKAVGYANNYLLYTHDGTNLLTVTADPSIFIKVQTRNEDYTSTVLHEAGHVLDSTIAFIGEGKYTNGQGSIISNDEEWLALYEKYASAIAGIDATASYNGYSSKEVFCEAFRLTYLKPDELIAVAPEVYEYVIKVVEKYCG